MSVEIKLDRADRTYRPGVNSVLFLFFLNLFYIFSRILSLVQ